MGEVRACVYFSVIFLCIQISIAKPFFGSGFWCDLFCEEDDGLTTTASSEDIFDAWCDDCFPPRPTPATTMPPPAINPAMPPRPLTLSLPTAMNISMIPDPSNGWWGFSFAPWSGVGGATAAPAVTAAPAPAASAAPDATTAAPTTAAPAAAKK